MELKSFSKSVVVSNKTSKNFIDDSIKLENFDRIQKTKILKRKKNLPAKEPFPHLALNKKCTDVIEEVDEEKENKIKRKNSNDIDSKQFERFLIKKKTLIHQEDSIRKPAKSITFQKIKKINDFMTDCIFLDKNKISYNCKLYIDSGADIIIGSHAHVLQGMEFYKDKLIVYNLGDFIFNNETKDTGIFTLNIDNNGTMSYKFIPCKEENEYTYLLTNNDKLSVLNKMKSWSININIDNDGNIKNN